MNSEPKIWDGRLEIANWNEFIDYYISDQSYTAFDMGGEEVITDAEQLKKLDGFYMQGFSPTREEAELIFVVRANTPHNRK